MCACVQTCNARLACNACSTCNAAGGLLTAPRWPSWRANATVTAAVLCRCAAEVNILLGKTFRKPSNALEGQASLPHPARRLASLGVLSVAPHAPCGQPQTPNPRPTDHPPQGPQGPEHRWHPHSPEGPSGSVRIQTKDPAPKGPPSRSRSEGRSVPLQKAADAGCCTQSGCHRLSCRNRLSLVPQSQVNLGRGQSQVIVPMLCSGSIDLD